MQPSDGIKAEVAAVQNRLKAEMLATLPHFASTLHRLRLPFLTYALVSCADIGQHRGESSSSAGSKLKSWPPLYSLLANFLGYA